MQKLPFLSRRYLLVWDLRLSKREWLKTGQHQNKTNKKMENWNFADDSLDRSDRACGPGVESHDQMPRPVKRRDGWMPKRLRRTDISQTHRRLESLRRKCPQAIWFLSAAYNGTNHHLNALKSNLTSDLQHKNIK
jgi:hypothetical protein